MSLGRSPPGPKLGEPQPSAHALYDLLLTLERTITLLNPGERVRLRWQSDAVWLQSHLYAIAGKMPPSPITSASSPTSTCSPWPWFPSGNLLYSLLSHPPSQAVNPPAYTTTRFTRQPQTWVWRGLFSKPQGYSDISLAVGAAGLSIRSFQRRLAAAGLNYGAVVNRVRFEL
ncbi:hypothetical protein PGN35_029120 [Nodosilinea sp. PGN35]|uniref:hypothetical protein n=1 Tax=Nodosilinea sp. PGN35 TaxID=3020489 RepID=UPI0023B3327D|nr:hypothetical protein [Nodosilinea sp. TSF1-S3]MDF0368252.1 hypothetical protein [Nodosilinea sp. TSF1-S3]